MRPADEILSDAAVIDDTYFDDNGREWLIMGQRKVIALIARLFLEVLLDIRDRLPQPPVSS